MGVVELRGWCLGVNLKATPKKEGGSRWWLQIFFYVHPYLPGEMDPI